MICSHGRETSNPMAIYDVCQYCNDERQSQRDFRRKLVLNCFSDWIDHGSVHQIGPCLHLLYDYAYNARSVGHTEASKASGTGFNS